MKFDTISEFINEMNIKLGWSDAELARKMGYTSSMVSLVVNGHIPSLRFCKRLAKAYNEPLENILIMAGLIDEKSQPPQTKLYNELTQIAARLPEQKLKEVVGFARYKLDEK